MAGHYFRAKRIYMRKIFSHSPTHLRPDRVRRALVSMSVVTLMAVAGCSPTAPEGDAGLPGADDTGAELSLDGSQSAAETVQVLREYIEKIEKDAHSTSSELSASEAEKTMEQFYSATKGVADKADFGAITRGARSVHVELSSGLNFVYTPVISGALGETSAARIASYPLGSGENQDLEKLAKDYAKGANSGEQRADAANQEAISSLDEAGSHLVIWEGIGDKTDDLGSFVLTEITIPDPQDGVDDETYLKDIVSQATNADSDAAQEPEKDNESGSATDGAADSESESESASESDSASASENASASPSVSESESESETKSESESASGPQASETASDGDTDGEKENEAGSDSPTASDNAPSYKDALGTFAINQNNAVVLTEKYFETYLNDDALEGSLVILLADHSGSGNLAEVLHDKGAQAVIAFTDVVNAEEAHALTEAILTKLLDGVSVQEAVEAAQQAVKFSGATSMDSTEKASEDTSEEEETSSESPSQSDSASSSDQPTDDESESTSASASASDSESSAPANGQWPVVVVGDGDFTPITEYGPWVDGFKEKIGDAKNLGITLEGIGEDSLRDSDKYSYALIPQAEVDIPLLIIARHSDPGSIGQIFFWDVDNQEVGKIEGTFRFGAASVGGFRGAILAPPSNDPLLYLITGQSISPVANLAEITLAFGKLSISDSKEYPSWDDLPFDAHDDSYQVDFYPTNEIEHLENWSPEKSDSND